jgi:uncharacterized membrane protein
MAASKSQGSYFGLFLVGGTILCAGIAYISTATGKLLFVVGAAVLLASLFGFLKIKPLEGATPVLPSPEIMKWIGAGLALLGWLVTLGGLHVVDSNGGRIVVALLGIGVSLVGMLYVMPAAFNKTAFWKQPAGQPAAMTSRAGFTSMAGRATLDSEMTAAPTGRESAAMGGAK